MNPAQIGALAAIVVGLLGLIGVPLSAQVTGMVQSHSERLKRRAKHESNALGTLLRAWIVMNQAYPQGTSSPAYTAAACDWLSALAEIAAYAPPAVSQRFADFVSNGATAFDAHGQELLVSAVFEVRKGSFHRRLPRSDRGAIAVLLFGEDNVA